MPTPVETLKNRFPNASASFLRLNSGISLPQPTGNRPISGKVAPDGPTEPPADRPLELAANGPFDHADPVEHRLTQAFERAKADYRASLAIVERHLRNGPLAKGPAENGHPRKFLVRVTSYRMRLLDEDNLCEKYHVDLCRYAGLLRTDAPGQARIVPLQERVRSKDEEKTVIEIEPL